MTRKALVPFDFPSVPLVNGANTWYVTPTGTNATGTWGISISGNAATVSSITSGQVTTALGYTPYNSTNPSGYQTAANVSAFFGSPNTSGVLDWNDVTNTKPGAAGTLLLGSATNGMGGGNYYHPLNFEYSSKDGTGNVTQMAVAYGSPANELWMRGRYNGAWTSWTRYLNSGNFNTYAPTLTGTGASGTWSINVTGSAGSAGSVAWSGVTGKPTTLSGYGITDGVKYGDIIQNDNPFGGNRLYYNVLGNQLFLANTRWTVTSSNVSNPQSLFDGDYEAPMTVAAGVTGVVTLDFGGDYVGYPYGDLLVSCYYSNIPDSVSIRVYCNYAPQGIGWKTLTVTKFKDSPTGTIFKANNQFYAIQQIELTVVAAAGTSALITQLELAPERPGNLPTPVFNKYRPETAYKDINWVAGSPKVSGNLVLHAGNYNTYAPTLTGTGASGTWSITATNLSNFTTTTSTNLGTDNATSAIGYISGISLLGQSDGALYSHVYSSVWKHNIYGDYRTGQLAVRGKNNGTWGAWRVVLDASNYNTYAPTLTGTGASGTWGISISGNAATATSATTSSTTNLVSVYDNRAVDDAPSSFTQRTVRYDFKNRSAVGNPPSTPSGTTIYSYIATHTHWIGFGGGGGATVQLNYGTEIDLRYATSDTTWSAWKTLLSSTNYNTYAPTLTGTGASGTWGISITGTSASTSAVGGVSSDRVMMKRRTRINTADSTSLNSSITAPEMGFTYGGSGEPVGPYIAFGGLNGNIDYSCQLVGQYNNGGNDFKIRTRNDDSALWNAWRTIITDGNYTDYTVTKTGTGASGTWPIAITGNANTVDGYHIQVDGTGTDPNTIYLKTTGGTVTVTWANVTGKPTTISGYGITDAVSTGASSLSSIGVTHGTIVNSNNPIATLPNGVTSWEARSNGTGPAVMTFHRSGAYAGFFGLDTDNVWKVGGWSMGANSYPVLHTGVASTYVVSLSGDQTVAGNKTFSGTTALASASTVDSLKIGYRNVPLGLSNGAKAIAQTDAGKGWYKNDTTAYTYTIPDGLEDGTVITIANLGSAGNITVSMSGSEVLRLAGTTTTGSRTIGPYGEGTFHRVGGVWLAGGQGVT